jgi:hypothetical protein
MVKQRNNEKTNTQEGGRETKFDTIQEENETRSFKMNCCVYTVLAGE